MINKARLLMAVERVLKWCDKEIKSRQKGAVQVMKKCMFLHRLDDCTREKQPILSIKK